MHTHRPSALVVPLTLVALVATITGCGHVNNLGRPPSDDQLINDGSPEARQALRDEYRVVYEQGEFRRPGPDHGTLADEIREEIDGYRAHPASDTTYNYLSSSEAAAEELDGIMVSTANFMAHDAGYSVAGAVGAGIGIALGFGAGAPFIGNADLTQVSTWTNYLFFAVPAAAVLAMAASTAAYFAHGAITVPLTNAFAVNGYRDAAAAFNRDLDKRIEANTDPNAGQRQDCAEGPADETPPVPETPATPETPVPPAPPSDPSDAGEEAAPAAESATDAPDADAPAADAPDADAPAADAPAAETPTDAPPNDAPATDATDADGPGKDV